MLPTLRRALLLVALTAAPLVAQNDGAAIPAGDTTAFGDSPWLLSYYPYVGGGLGGGPALYARVRFFQPATWQNRVTYRQEAWAEAGIGLHGSRVLGLGYSAPLFAPGWRVAVEAGALRDTRADFYGLGNDTQKDDAREAADEFAYHMQETRYQVNADVSRQITGPVHIAIGGLVRHTRFAQLSATSEFASAFGSTISETDPALKAELVYDGRDNEFDPKQGVLAQLGAETALGDTKYQRVFSIVQGYVHPFEKTVVAARLGASQLYGSPSLGSRLDLPTWENPLDVYGGGSTNRGLDRHRLVGTGVLFANAEVRQDLLWFYNAVGVTAVAFVDAGRVFEGQKLRVTTEDLAVSVGGGLVFRILRSTMVGAYLATGPDGVRFSGGGGWMF